jgi:hypothetical protein
VTGEPPFPEVGIGVNDTWAWPSSAGLAVIPVGATVGAVVPGEVVVVVVVDELDGGGVDGSRKPLNSNLFGLPDPALVTLPVVALFRIAVVTCVGEALGNTCRNRAATPAMSGAAIDVPLTLLVAVLLVYHADFTPLPGANRSRQLPVFESVARASVFVVKPAATAAGRLAGERLHADVPPFPPETK